MTKLEIIAAVSHVNVPEGAQMVTRNTVMGQFPKLTKEAVAKGAGKLYEAAQLQEHFTGTLPMSGEPDAEFFAKLHYNVSLFYGMAMMNTIFDALVEEMTQELERIIAKIRELAKELNITYVEPT